MAFSGFAEAGRKASDVEVQETSVMIRNHDSLRDDRSGVLTKNRLLKRRIDLLDEKENLNFLGRGDRQFIL